MVFCHFLAGALSCGCASLGSEEDRLVCHTAIYHCRYREYWRRIFHSIYHPAGDAYSEGPEAGSGSFRPDHGCVAVVPKNSAASAWGLACIGNGLGGAVFQSISGVTLKSVSAVHGYTSAYNILFIGFGISALIGVSILLFGMGPLVKDEALQRYADGE